MQSLLKAHKLVNRTTYKNILYSCRCERYLNALNNKQIKTLYLIKNPSIVRQFNISNRFKDNELLLKTNIVRQFHISNEFYDKEPLKPSSKIEKTVQAIKEQESESKESKQVVVKRSIRQKIVDEILHYYHGFRLLFIDIKISSVLVWRLLSGNQLTRREHKLLIRTVGDLFRLVPFSVFIIVPFMEFLLPFFIKFFPGMLPSTFQTAKDKEEKIKQNLKVKIEMAKFLQQTLDDMAVHHRGDHHSDLAKQFSEWFHRVRKTGELVSTEEIMKFSKLFEDEITLDSLSHNQTKALCRVLEIQTFGTTNFLKFLLRMKLRTLAADDKMIQKEGIDALTFSEVQQACRARGIRAYGVPEERLRRDLEQWLDLSINKKVPPSLLLLSRALMLPETIPASDKLKATISALPENIIARTKAAIGEKEGKIDNKVKLEVLKEEERKCKEEREQQKKEKEMIVDKAPILNAESTPELKDSKDEKSIEVTSKDMEVLEDALDSLSKDKKMFLEKGDLEDLKEEMAEYKEDVQELTEVIASGAGGGDKNKIAEIGESKGAKRLFNKVNRMIGKMETMLQNLEKKESELKADFGENKMKSDELIRIDELMETIKNISNTSLDKSKLLHIAQVLAKIDDDLDGHVKVEDVQKVIEIIGKEDVQLSAEQIDEIMKLIDKEEILELEEKIIKTLQKTRGDVEKIHVTLSKKSDSKTSDTNKIDTKIPQVPIPPPSSSSGTDKKSTPSQDL